MNRKIAAIVPAAGIGKRLGPGTNKPFHLLLEKPLIVWAIEFLEQMEEITEIVPVLKESDMGEGLRVFERFGFSKVKRAVPGGSKRQDSVYNGLRHLGGDPDIVVIHDGVRPLVEIEKVREAITAIDGCEGAVLGVPVKDTIKQVEADVVHNTLKRDNLWAAQTPQVFLRDALVRAYDRAMAERFYGTDDSALVERIGGKVKVIMGSYSNIKITTPDDLPLAEFLLRRKMGYDG
jgi:2-C-methyl-D-erythritol 4-phosphate cytidylyltransferase